MKKLLNVILPIIIGIYILVINIFFSDLLNSSYYRYIINPIFFIIITIILFSLNKNETVRIKKEEDKYKTILVYTISYIIIYLLIGLVTGFQKSAYSHSINGIFKNAWSILLIVFLREYCRNNLLNKTNNKLYYVLITVLFFIFTITLNIPTEYSLTNEGLFKYLCMTVLPGIFEGILLSYLSLKAGLKSVYSYLIPITLMNLLTPVFPDIDWFYQGIIGVIFPIIIFVQINYIELKDDKYISRKKVKKESPLKKIPVFLGLVLLALFVGGFLRYYPLTILSGSMLPTIEIGDVVVIEKKQPHGFEKIKNHDIIAYRLDSRVIIHRVIKIDKTNKTVITQGDNNNTPDPKKVEDSQILGTIKFKIPKLGFPSLWLNKILNS